jgi:uncharacterized protein YoaH (UPF0181 family)
MWQLMATGMSMEEALKVATDEKNDKELKCENCH